jgi:hypothetical protein
MLSPSTLFYACVYVVTMLTHVDACGLKLEYRIDVCRVTRGAHIEHL